MAEIRPRILIVDDDVAYLHGLRGKLASLCPHWNVIDTQSGAEALVLLSRAPFDVILSSTSTAGMDGTELLTVVADRFPSVIRFINCAPTDTDAFLRTTQLVHQCFAKTCEPSMLKDRLERAVVLRKVLLVESLRHIVSQTRFLPGMPDLYLRIRQELHSPQSSMQRIGKLIEQDASVTAKILKVVNSAFFGLSQPVTNPAFAVSLLGLEIVQSMIVLADVLTQFERMKVQIPGFSCTALQQHCFNVGEYAHAIARRQGSERQVTDCAFTAGLLHDVGKLILAANFPREYAGVLAMVQEKKVPAWSAEWSVFGTTHAEVGAYILGLWGLPDPIVESVVFHHQPSACPQRSHGALTAVHLADGLHHEQLDPAGMATGKYFDAKFLQELQIDEELQEWRTLCKPIEGYRATLGPSTAKLSQENLPATESDTKSVWQQHPM